MVIYSSSIFSFILEVAFGPPVKKRDPLILPPEYNTLPKPNSVNKSKKTDGNKINKILKFPDDQMSTTKGSSSVEESIMKNIRK